MISKEVCWKIFLFSLVVDLIKYFEFNVNKISKERLEWNDDYTGWWHKGWDGFDV